VTRPTVVTDDVLSKLNYAFSVGCSDLEACCYAGIGTTTLYRYQEKNEEFRERKNVLKSNPFMKAKEVLYNALLEGDVQVANKMIDRQEGKKVNVDLSNTDGTLQPTTIQLVAMPEDHTSVHSEH